MCGTYGRFYCEKGHEHQCHPRPEAGADSFWLESFRPGSRFPIEGDWTFPTDDDDAKVEVRQGKVTAVRCLRA